MAECYVQLVRRQTSTQIIVQLDSTAYLCKTLENNQTNESVHTHSHHKDICKIKTRITRYDYNLTIDYEVSQTSH
jgi:hypothetical protein